MTEIERAKAADVEDVLALLQRNGLPVEGLADHAPSLLVARDGNRVVGSAAIELYGDAGLLRSVVVDASARGSGLGQRLTRSALQLARDRGVHDVYLLTTTAEDYFPRLGFQRIAREDVPQSVRASVEFQSACPASAVVMRRRADKDG